MTPWWIITLRNSGDDEDSFYIGQHADLDAAWDAAVSEIRDRDELPPIPPDATKDPEVPTFISYVFRSDTKPTLALSNC